MSKCILITLDRKRHVLDMPHEPHHTEWIELPGYGLVVGYWEGEENGMAIYRDREAYAGSPYCGPVFTRPEKSAAGGEGGK